MKLFQWIRLLGKPLYEYGTCRDKPARRNRLTGEVQFVLWKAGEQGHTEDYWHKFGDGWEKQFKPHTASRNSMTHTPAANNGGKTGWPAPPLLQDDHRPLSQWLSSRLGARYALKVAIKERRGEQKPSES